MWSRFMKLSQIEYHDKFSLLTVIQASIDFYDVIKTIQNSVQGIFSEIMATTSRLNTFYRIETSYGHSSRHFRITENVLRHFRRFWRINDVINVGFFCYFAVFGYSKRHKIYRNSWFSHRICILIGPTTLPSLKCNRLYVAELWRHIRRKSAISSTSLFKMTDF